MNSWSVHRVPGECVVLLVILVCLDTGYRNGGETDENDDRQQDDYQWQKEEEYERAKKNAYSDGFPTDLPQMEADGWLAWPASLNSNVLAAHPGQQAAKCFAEGSQVARLHPAMIRMAILVARCDEGGSARSGGMIYRGHLVCLAVRDRVHGGGWLWLKRPSGYYATPILACMH
jgi:hypothetical protein